MFCMFILNLGITLQRQLKEIFEGVGPVKVVSLKSSKGDHKTNYAYVVVIYLN